MQDDRRPRASLDDALAIMRDLRARDAWDRAQTHASLRPYLNEEMHELDDALREGDDAAMVGELGDVLLQVLFHAVIAEERGAFGPEHVAGSLVGKMRCARLMCREHEACARSSLKLSSSLWRPRLLRHLPSALPVEARRPRMSW